MRVLAIAFLLIFALAANTANTTEAAQTFIVNTYDSAPLYKTDGTGNVDRIIREAFRRINTDFVFRNVPLKRGIRDANSGKNDGHYPRTLGAIKKFENLVPVSEPLDRGIYVAIAKQPDIVVKGWESLKSYRVGYPLGWAIFESNRERFGGGKRVSKLTELLNMVDRGELQVALFNLTVFHRVASKSLKTRLKALSPPLSSKSLLFVIHKKHAALVPKLVEALQEMKRDGTFGKLCEPCAKRLGIQ